MDIQSLAYEDNEVRMIMIDGEPWWVLKDVCGTLGIVNHKNIVKRLDDDEVHLMDLVDSKGKNQEMYAVNESGLYNVILRSDKPEAQKFKRWITHEILPSIRKHGIFATDDLLSDPDLLISALQRLKTERMINVALNDTVNVQNQQIADMTVKSSYYDLVLNTTDAISISAIAKDFGKSGRWLNNTLHKLGVQYEQGDLWVLYQKYADKGYTCTKTHTYLGKDGTNHSRPHTYWTQKGRQFIIELLISNGYAPFNK